MTRRHKGARFPIVRGARVAGSMPVSTVRVFAIVMGAAILVVLALIGIVAHDSEVRHNQRTADQKDTNHQIAILACGQAHLILDLAPDSVRAKQYAEGLLKQYHCSSLRLVKTPGASTPGALAPPVTTAVVRPPARVVPVSRASARPTHGARPSHSPTPTHVRTTPTSSPSPTPPHSPPPPRVTPPLALVTLPVQITLCVGGLIGVNC